MFKEHEDFCAIPVVVLTSSQAATDVIAGYQSHANAHITKPHTAGTPTSVIGSIESFYGTIAALPTR